MPPSELKSQRFTRGKTIRKLNDNIVMENLKRRIDILDIVCKRLPLYEVEDVYKLIMNAGSPDSSRRGFIFESIVTQLIAAKCFTRISYTNVMDGRIGKLLPIKTLYNLIDVPISQGDNPADMIIQDGETIVAVSCKHYSGRISVDQTDIEKLKSKLDHNGVVKYKIALIVRDKNDIQKIKHSDDSSQFILDQIKKDGLLFDETDVIRALTVFKRVYCSTETGIVIRSLDELVEKINKDCLGITRERLFVKMHQEITRLKFIKFISQPTFERWCIAHKMRSGKSITILLLCKYLLENAITKRILVMTSVRDTLAGFYQDLDKYIEFRHIKYKKQKKEDFGVVDDGFIGIIFCSTQFLKMDGTTTDKKKIIKKYKFDAIFMDECQLGGATAKTQDNIMNADQAVSPDETEPSNIVDEIQQNIRIRVFVSGTADSTCRALGIHQKSIWDFEDEIAMKHIGSSEVSQLEKPEHMAFMSKRHGMVEFNQCFNDQTLNRDYSKCPISCLIRHTIPPELEQMITNYNKEHNTTLGYDCSELFSLSQVLTVPDKENPNNRKVEYTEEFAICKNNSGIKLLKGWLNSIISNDMNSETSIINRIETTQTRYGSRISTKENPLLFLVYLPTHTGNGNIHMLQNTLKQFIEDNGLWSNYHVASSNSKDTHGGDTYTDFVEQQLAKTKEFGKIGCVLLLGNQGTVGITYTKCDVTIHLDSGMNLDSQKQRMARALTDAEGKTIGINVDMNIQRTYTFVLDKLHQYRHATNTTKTYTEILQYMFKRNIFLFNPHEINFGNIQIDEIRTYYKRQIDEIMKSGVVNDSVLLDQILCEDSFRNIIREYQHSRVIQHQVINPILNGCHPDVPTGTPDKVNVDSYTVPPKPDATPCPEQIPPEQMDEIINITFEICRTFLFPLLAMISRVFDSEVQTFANIFTNPKTKLLLLNLLKDKKIDLNEDTYPIFIDAVNTIINANMEIVNNIREIYRTTNPLRYRELIAKHFIPTETERKGNAEVPTPVPLVNDMLNKMPSEFWKTPKKVFEPCCGKGNFVLGIFDKFWDGLAESIPDEIKRCRIIMMECIYYADLTALNVFITTEIMKCHIQSYCGLTVLDYEFNTFVGDTLNLNVSVYWQVSGFDAIIGNPPFQESSTNGERKALNHNLWSDFINYSFKLIVSNGYLMFITPCSWMSPTSKNIDVFYKHQILYLNVNECKRHFNGVGSTFSYYLIQKTTVKSMTEVVCLYKNKTYTSILSLSGVQFLPNLLSGESVGIIRKFYTNDLPKVSFSKNFELHSSTHKSKISDTQTTTFCFPIRHTTTRNIRYSSVKHSLSDASKILMNLSGDLRPVYDSGLLGFTEAQMYLLTNNPHFVDILNSKLYQFVFKTCKWSGFNIDKVFHNIPYIDRPMPDAEIAELFGLTDDELSIINVV